MYVLTLHYRSPFSVKCHILVDIQANIPNIPNIPTNFCTGFFTNQQNCNQINLNHDFISIFLLKYISILLWFFKLHFSKVVITKEICECLLLNFFILISSLGSGYLNMYNVVLRPQHWILLVLRLAFWVKRKGGGAGWGLQSFGNSEYSLEHRSTNFTKIQEKSQNCRGQKVTWRSSLIRTNMMHHGDLRPRYVHPWLRPLLEPYNNPISKSNTQFW